MLMNMTAFSKLKSKEQMLLSSQKMIGILLDSGVIETPLEELINLSTGHESAVFLIKSKNEEKIIKFRAFGAVAEAIAYKKWKRQGVKVPTVVHASSKHSQIEYDYIVMEVIRDQFGNLAKTANFIGNGYTEALEFFLGKELAKMHKASGLIFGEVENHVFPNQTFETWKDYLLEELHRHFYVLKNLIKLDRSKINSFILLAEKTKSNNPVYAHGDFGNYNLMITNYAPIDGVIFDPNPCLCDPYYDLANYLNGKEAWAKKKINIDSDCFLKAYLSESGLSTIDQGQLSLNRAFRAINRFYLSYQRGSYRAKIYERILFEQLEQALNLN